MYSATEYREGGVVFLAKNSQTRSAESISFAGGQRMTVRVVGSTDI